MQKLKDVIIPCFTESCLVEDTDYLATSALKNFHFAIYGSAVPGFFELFKLAMQTLSREDLTLFPDEGVYQCENKETSPAFSVELRQSFETVVEQIQKMNESQSGQGLDLAQMEWLAKALCNATGTDYTREHAEVLSDYLSEVRVQSALTTKDGSSNIIESFPALFQEIFCGDTMQKFKARVQEIERRSQHETESETSEVIVNCQRRFTPGNPDADESGSSSVPSNDDEEPCVTPQNCENDRKVPGNIKPTESFDLMESSRPDPKNDVVDDNSEDSIKTDESGTEMRNSSVKEKLTSEDVTHSEDDKDKAKKKQAWRTSYWLEHLLGTRTEMKEGTANSKEYKRKEGIDLVPALRSHGWPKVVREWIKRDRKWPSSEIVDKVIQEGYHMVVKPPKNGDSKCYFRIWFSHAELVLSHEMNEVQRECYRCMKKFTALIFPNRRA